MPLRTLVVVNPASRSGATGRRWPDVEARLRDALGALDVAFTRGPRDAERIAREAVRAGVERLIVAGGDGTTSEVISGLLGADLGGEAEIGLLPLGTGGDFMRTLGPPAKLDAAIAALAGSSRRRLDAGRIQYRDRSGDARRAFFLNVASCGISGLVDELVNRAPKALGGTASFAIGTLRALARFRPTSVEVRVDGEIVHAGPLTLAAAANGRYFGGGMHIAPQASPDDGRLDVVVVPGLSRARLLANLPSLYTGRHLEHAEVSLVRGSRVELIGPSAAGTPPVWLDVDGEPLGTLPALLELLPGAVTLFGVESGSSPAQAA